MTHRSTCAGHGLQAEAARKPRLRLLLCITGNESTQVIGSPRGSRGRLKHTRRGRAPGHVSASDCRSALGPELCASHLTQMAPLGPAGRRSSATGMPFTATLTRCPVLALGWACGPKFYTRVNSPIPSNDPGRWALLSSLYTWGNRGTGPFDFLSKAGSRECSWISLCTVVFLLGTQRGLTWLCSLRGLWKARPREGSPSHAGPASVPQAAALCPSTVLDLALPGVTLSSVLAPAGSQRRLPMHHRAAVTPEPACHLHPSFSNRFLSGSEGGQAEGGGW